tara:strand:- start:157 stop:564 length:408 start_codon:yes stop_codon:yes gene_type:complete
MESHLHGVDESLEALTKKVQKHTMLKTPELINNYSFDKNSSTTTKEQEFTFKSLLKPPYVFIIGLPLLFLILLIYLQPSFIMDISPDKTDPVKQVKTLSIKKLLIWSLVLAGILGGGIYYFFYMKKQNVQTPKTE